MLRRALTLALAASLSSAALVGAQPPQETYYQGKLMNDWLQQLVAPAPELRLEAVQALGHIGPPANVAVPYLRDLAIKDPDGAVRLAANDAVDRIIVPAEFATARILVTALRDPDPIVTEGVLESIIKLDKKAWYATAGLERLKDLQEEKKVKADVQKAAKKAAEAIEKSLKAEDLVKDLTSKDEKVRSAAQRKLEIVKNHPLVKKAFLKAITDSTLSEQSREILRREYERAYLADRER